MYRKRLIPLDRLEGKVKFIPGLEPKYAMNLKGEVVCVETWHNTTTAPYLISQTRGPFVRIIDRPNNREARICVLKVYYELYGKRLAGWTEIDPDEIKYDSRPKSINEG